MFSYLYPISPYNSTMIIANSVPFPTNISSVYNENCSIFIREIYYSLQFKTTEKNEVTILHVRKNDNLPLAPDFAGEIPRKKAKEISTAIFLLTELASPPFYKVRREKQANFLTFDKFN